MDHNEGAGGIEFSREGIGQILFNKYLLVPDFQRTYSWGDAQVTEFWDDLNGAIAEQKPVYFLGTIVVTSDERTDRLAIIDGQQRLATTTLILAAMRDALAAGNHTKDAELVFNQFLATEELGVQDPKPKFLMNAEDEPFFRRIINSPATGVTLDRSAPESHKRLRRAYDLLRTKVQELVNSTGPTWNLSLYNWIKYLRTSAQVIVVTVSTEADAFLIFETLNDRGLDLTVADLLKNHLFRLSGDRIESAKINWIASEATISQSGEKAPFVSFLRHDWTARYGLVRERDLYRKMRHQLTDAQQAIDYAAQLNTSSYFYSAILSRDHDFWSNKGTGTRSDIDTLMRLRLEQTRPLLLAVMQSFANGELKKAIKSLVSWSVRSLVANTAGTGRTEQAYASAALQVMKGVIGDNAALFAHLDSVIPSDSDFEAAFRRTKPIIRLARYYLLVLENHNTGQAEPELIPNGDEDQVNLEHILPKKATAGEWPTFTTDQMKDYVDRLGNMVLLQRSANGRIGNAPFSTKAPILGMSDLELTNEVGALSNWTPEEIEKRQERLARLAVAAWSKQP